MAETSDHFTDADRASFYRVLAARRAPRHAAFHTWCVGGRGGVAAHPPGRAPGAFGGADAVVAFRAGVQRCAAGAHRRVGGRRAAGHGRGTRQAWRQVPPIEGALARVLRLPEGAQPMALLCIGPLPAFYGEPMLAQTGWRHGRPLGDGVFIDTLREG